MNNRFANLAHPHRAAARQRGSVRLWLLVAILLIACGAGLWWWKVKPTQLAGNTATPAASAPREGANARRAGASKGAQPVSVQTVRRQDIHVTVNAIGSIGAMNTAIVRAQVSGVLRQLNFMEGQQVKAGEVLAQIDPRVYQAALAQAEGALTRDKAQLEGARVDLARYRDLITKDAIPRQQLETQVALVAQLEGTVKLDQAAVDSARLQLSYTNVTAPIAGRAGLKQLDLGNVAQTTDANGVVIVTQTRPIALVFAVPSANVPLIAARLRSNQSLPVEAWDRTGKARLAVGQVMTLDNAIDPTTDTIKVKAVFANADDALYPNQAVSVRLQLDTLTDTLAVPQGAVLRGTQGFYVYRVNPDSSVSVRVVTPGAIDGDWMAIEGPLQPGEQVVIDGVDRLREGAKVEVIQPIAKNSPRADKVSGVQTRAQDAKPDPGSESPTRPRYRREAGQEAHSGQKSKPDDAPPP